MPVLTDLDAVTAHIRTAYAGREHYLILGTGLGRPAIAGLAAFLLSSGVHPQRFTVGRFGVASHCGTVALAVGFLTVPKSIIHRPGLVAYLADAAVLMGVAPPELAPDQDIVIMAEEPDAVGAALAVIVGDGPSGPPHAEASNNPSGSPIAPQRAPCASPRPTA